jgi:deoxyguanosine kinase
MPISQNKFVAIEGNIGSGKTSLAKKLAEHFHAECVLEEFEKNPFLELFYSDPNAFAYPLEYSFFLDRVRQLMNCNFSKNRLFISDYIIQKCLWFASLNLSKKEFDFFNSNFESLAKLYPKPDLLFFLHLPLDLVIDNIKKRGRQIEKKIDSDYLKRLNDIYAFESEKVFNENDRPVYQFFLSNNTEEQYEFVFKKCVEIIANRKKNHSMSKIFQL